MAGGLAAGLAYAWVESQIADQLARAREATDIPGPGDEGRGGDQVDARHGEQPLKPLDLLIEYVDLAQTAFDRDLLVGREGETGQPASAGATEEVLGRRSRVKVAQQRCVHLVFRARASAHERGPAGEQPSQGPQLLVGRPYFFDHPGGEQPGQGASVEPIGLRARPDEPAQPPGVRDDHARDVRSKDPHDRGRVACRLEGHLVVAMQTSREALQLDRDRRDAAKRADTARVRGCDLAEVAVDIQSDETHFFSFQSADGRGQNDKDGSVLTAHPGRSQGRPKTTPGSQPIGYAACPTCSSQRAPDPEMAIPTPLQAESSARSFMPRQRLRLRQEPLPARAAHQPRHPSPPHSALPATHERKVERFHQTMAREWAYGLLYRSHRDRAAALPHWLDHYNTTRPHSSLDGQPPISRVHNVCRHGI